MQKIGLTKKTEEELIAASKSGNELYLHLYPSDEYFDTMHEYVMDRVSSSARQELLEKENNPSI